MEQLTTKKSPPKTQPLQKPHNHQPWKQDLKQLTENVTNFKEQMKEKLSLKNPQPLLPPFFLPVQQWKVIL